MNRAHLLGTVLALAPPLTATAAQGDVRSPTLRRFVPADDGALATFWRSAERNGTPLIESIPGDTVNLLVTFLFRGDGGTRSVHPESNIVDPLTPPQKRSAPATTTFARLGATNLWWLNVEAPRTLRAPYALVATSRHLRDVLVAKGYRVTYREFVGVHHDVDWEDAFARAVSGSAGDRGR